ncbi:hypothetical protein EXIGLDRAFT_728505 [Exidia glandulosa HHB12029]|uniref:Uncharacterized protein n=1 Tax=Exidia glandulosa HHB12029 TaxID=1314781 RepID=A0A165CWC8_EXIGL|nr:hypothetical protein EXIGLDRAFT_728505 [Exidia glandulosa HHB12029]
MDVFLGPWVIYATREYSSPLPPSRSRAEATSCSPNANDSPTSDPALAMSKFSCLRGYLDDVVLGLECCTAALAYAG